MEDIPMNNIKPKERSERVSYKTIINNYFGIFKIQITNRNRDNIEKAYLQDRVGMFNKPSEKINLNSPDPNSDIYISEGERFNKDFAAYDYNRRNQEHERKKEMYQNRKNQLYERERKRWEKMDYEYLRNENKIMMNKERNLVGRKNNPGRAFNPLTLQYDNSVQGEILKRRDDESKFRALMRATNIDKHANAGYNIINGEERTIMENRMLKEIEPSVYKKNIDKINEINQRHNNNDNFYTKGPSYNQPKNQYEHAQDLNEKEYINNNEKNVNIYFNVNINKSDYEINISLNKKELDKVKDIDIIISNYIMMKKELDELKEKFEINDDDLFYDSVLIQRNKYIINLFKEGIKKQLNKNIKKTNLLYRCTRDGDSCTIFHQKCDNIAYTLVVGEAINGKKFGGFTIQNWDTKSGAKYDDYAFLFDISRMKNYYVIKGKGGIYCANNYGPTFGNGSHFSLTFQDSNKNALQNGGNREDCFNMKKISYNYENYDGKNYIFEGSHQFQLKDYEVFELSLI